MENKIATSPESAYRLLFEQSRDAITIVTAEGIFLDANNAFLELTGYTRHDLQCMNAADLWLNAADRQRWRKELAKHRSLIDYESRQKKKNGEIVDILLTTSMRTTITGQIIYQTILRDVTLKKLVEAEKERLISELKEALGKIRTLEDVLPLCVYCKKIRKEDGSHTNPEDWMSLERYVVDFTNSRASHSICPDCLARHYPELS